MATGSTRATLPVNMLALSRGRALPGIAAGRDGGGRVRSLDAAAAGGRWAVHGGQPSLKCCVAVPPDVGMLQCRESRRDRRYTWRQHTITKNVAATMLMVAGAGAKYEDSRTKSTPLPCRFFLAMETSSIDPANHLLLVCGARQITPNTLSRGRHMEAFARGIQQSVLYNVQQYRRFCSSRRR